MLYAFVDLLVKIVLMPEAAARWFLSHAATCGLSTLCDWRDQTRWIYALICLFFCLFGRSLPDTCELSSIVHFLRHSLSCLTMRSCLSCEHATICSFRDFEFISFPEDSPSRHWTYEHDRSTHVRTNVATTHLKG